MSDAVGVVQLLRELVEDTDRFVVLDLVRAQQFALVDPKSKSVYIVMVARATVQPDPSQGQP